MVSLSFQSERSERRKDTKYRYHKTIFRLVGFEGIFSCMKFVAIGHFYDFRPKILHSRPKIQFKVGFVKQNFSLGPTVSPLGPKNEYRLNRWSYQKILLHGPHLKLNFRARALKIELKIAKPDESRSNRFYVLLYCKHVESSICDRAMPFAAKPNMLMPNSNS